MVNDLRQNIRIDLNGESIPIPKPNISAGFH
jgi:hypothetical protein